MSNHSGEMWHRMAKEGWSRKGKRYKWWYVCIIAGRWVDAEYLVGSKGVRGGGPAVVVVDFLPFAMAGSGAARSPSPPGRITYLTSSTQYTVFPVNDGGTVAVVRTDHIGRDDQALSVDQRWEIDEF